MNRLVVQTLLSRVDSLALERWFDAVIDALSGATAPAVGEWTVAVGISDDIALSDDHREHFAAKAAAAAGSFVVVPVGSDRLAAHRAIARAVDAEEVLIVDVDVTVLASSIERLLSARKDGIGPLMPREIPLGDLRAGDGTQSAPGCVLLNAVQLEANDSLSGTGDYCEQAVVHRDRRLPAITASPESSRGSVSLLEGALAAAGANDSVVAVERQFTAAGELLLSVVMRTQLSRPEALRDALTCLTAQADDRFEVIIVVHDADEAAVEVILADQPQRLRERTRILSAGGGTRSRPLNVGIAAARGSHVSFLDDDDLVFAHWVSCALEGAGRSPRQVIRSAVAVQHVAATEWTGEISGHRADSGLTVPYPAAFNLADHLRVNMTPFMALAFPRRFFEVSGGADEELVVCEDWDLLLRAASTLGVADIPDVTAVYRRWTTGLDSYTVHDAEIWERDMRRVRARLDAHELVLPPGSATELADMSLLRDSPSELAAVYGSTSWRITAPLRAVSRFVSRLRGPSA